MSMSGRNAAVERYRKSTRRVVGMVAAAVLVSGLSVAGCASEPPPSPSKKEIYSDSDRFFDKMKQEEQGRGKEADAPAR